MFAILERTMDATIDFSHNISATPNGTLSSSTNGGFFFWFPMWVVFIRNVLHDADSFSVLVISNLLVMSSAMLHVLYVDFYCRGCAVLV